MSTPNSNLIAAIRSTRSPEFVAKFDGQLAKLESGDAACAFGLALYEHNKETIADVAAIAKTPCDSWRDLLARRVPWAPDGE